MLDPRDSRRNLGLLHLRFEELFERPHRLEGAAEVVVQTGSRLIVEGRMNETAVGQLHDTACLFIWDPVDKLLLIGAGPEFGVFNALNTEMTLDQRLRAKIFVIADNEATVTEYINFIRYDSYSEGPPPVRHALGFFGAIGDRGTSRCTILEIKFNSLSGQVDFTLADPTASSQVSSKQFNIRESDIAED